MPGGSYLPWEDVNFIRHDGSITTTIEEEVNTEPTQEWAKDRTVPKISFCEKHKKWKLFYIVDDGETNDHGASMQSRYFNTKEEIFELMMKE